MSTVSTMKCVATSTNKWRRKAEHQSREELARMCNVKCCSCAQTAKLSLMKNEKLKMDHSNIVRYQISEIYPNMEATWNFNLTTPPALRSTWRDAILPSSKASRIAQPSKMTLRKWRCGCLRCLSNVLSHLHLENSIKIQWHRPQWSNLPPVNELIFWCMKCLLWHLKTCLI